MQVTVDNMALNLLSKADAKCALAALTAMINYKPGSLKNPSAFLVKQLTKGMQQVCSEALHSHVS